MGFITGFVVYIATLIRAVAFSMDDSVEGPLILILIIFKFAIWNSLISLFPWIIWVYISGQSLLQPFQEYL